MVKTDLVVTGYIIDKDKLLLIHHKKLNLWLPVGGHIEQNEIPDDALKREIKEETNLDVEIISSTEHITPKGNTKISLATPFHVNVHSVGDHDHCSLFYICKPLNPDALKINSELKNFRWVSKDELDDKTIPEDVKDIAIKAFKIINK